MAGSRGAFGRVSRRRRPLGIYVTEMCKKTGKRRYRDRLTALMKLASAQRADGSGRTGLEKRAYRCPDCHGWHLTSRKKGAGRAPRGK